MDTMEQLQESRRRIMLKHGEFNPIVLRMELLEDVSPRNLFKTGWTDGKVLAFHPEFVAQLDKDEIDTFIMHECFHVAFLHTFSQRVKLLAEQDRMLLFEATDHVVNNVLVEAGFKSLERIKWVCDTKYRGWALEAVFEDLRKQGRKARRTIDVHLMPGDENNMTAEEKAEWDKLKKEWQKALADVITIAKQRGTLGAGLEKLVDETLESVVPWTQILVDSVTRRLGKSETTWNRPSRRGRVLDLYLPSTYDLCVDCVVFCFDTSGSMWDDPFLAQGFAELKACCKQLNVKRTILIEADVGVARGPEVIDDATLLSTEVKGGGGTSFVHAIRAAEAFEPQLIVYITDMEGEFPKEPCDFPVLWVTKSEHVAPFGETLRVR